MTISFKVSEDTKNKMIDYFDDKKRGKTPPYAVFQANEADNVITLYESGKVVFQGKSADVDANMWQEIEKKANPNFVIEEKKEKKEKKVIEIDPKIYNSSSIGSDEVGTGDYFGPIVVSAAYVNKRDIPYLEELGIKDSKKLTDAKILEIVPSLIKRINYSSIILTNSEYNRLYNEDMNMNKVKAILHNKVLLKMKEKNLDYNYIVVDEFAKEFVYYNYLKTSPNIVRNITFLTKGEDRCLSVACASLISRYIFLKEFDKLGQKYDTFLLKGASNLVDEQGLNLVKKHGVNVLNDISKLNFKNTKKIMDNIK
ncbi:MAG: ribonuclease HIII [Mycoplasmatota bacterium]